MCDDNLLAIVLFTIIVLQRTRGTLNQTKIRTLCLLPISVISEQTGSKQCSTNLATRTKIWR